LENLANYNKDNTSSVTTQSNPAYAGLLPEGSNYEENNENSKRNNTDYLNLVGTPERTSEETSEETPEETPENDYLEISNEPLTTITPITPTNATHRNATLTNAATVSSNSLTKAISAQANAKIPVHAHSNAKLELTNAVANPPATQLPQQLVQHATVTQGTSHPAPAAHVNAAQAKGIAAAVPVRAKKHVQTYENSGIVAESSFDSSPPTVSSLAHKNVATNAASKNVATNAAVSPQLPPSKETTQNANVSSMHNKNTSTKWYTKLFLHRQKKNSKKHKNKPLLKRIANIFRMKKSNTNSRAKNSSKKASLANLNETITETDMGNGRSNAHSQSVHSTNTVNSSVSENTNSLRSESNNASNVRSLSWFTPSKSYFNSSPPSYTNLFRETNV
jgi:hypothetical protein